MRLIAAVLALACLGPKAEAQPLTVTQVSPHAYAIVGPFGQRNPDNLGNNATFGLVVTEDGAVLVDPGGSRQGAALLDAAVQTVTDAPVRYVIDTGGQDHRWLGNGYWQDKGADIIASAAAVADQKARGSLQMTMLSQLVGSGLDGTEPAFANTVFEDRHSLTLGGVTLEIVHAGPAHTPGDSFVWLEDEGVVFTGDIVFTGRLLGVLDVSSSLGWVAAFEAMAALEPTIVVPGHGPAVDLATATRDTHDYLVNLRSRMAEHIDAGGDIIGAVEVDQSAFADLREFDMLARRNAQEVFSQMEWE